MSDREEALRIARSAFHRASPDDVRMLATALLDAEAEIERLRHRVLTPLTEADVVAALHNGHAERRAAQGDNAWASLLGERDELRAEVKRLRSVYEAARAWRWSVDDYEGECLSNLCAAVDATDPIAP